MDMVGILSKNIKSKNLFYNFIQNLYFQIGYGISLKEFTEMVQNNKVPITMYGDNDFRVATFFCPSCGTSFKDKHVNNYVEALKEATIISKSLDDHTEYCDNCYNRGNGIITKVTKTFNVKGAWKPVEVSFEVNGSAHIFISDILSRKREDKHNIKIGNTKLEAYNTNIKEICILLQSAEIYEKCKDNEGFNLDYKFVDKKELNSLRLPRCNTPYWLSSSTVINGNSISEDADVNGTLCGAKAETMYVLWVEDIKKYFIAYVSYWSM